MGAVRVEASGEAAAEEDLSGELFELAVGYVYSAALQAAARFRIADLLAVGPRTCGELAESAGVDGASLQRVLRYLATKGVFREDGAGRFHLTPLADPLRCDAPRSLRDFVLMRGEDIFWRPAGRLHEAVRTGGTVFEDLFGVPFYDYLAADPVLAARFNASMAAFSDTLSDDVARAYDFSAAGGRTGHVVDVGGGRGGLLRAVLRRHPGLTGVLFELPSVVADHVLDDPGLAGRWSAVAGSFFDAVPAGGDVYLLKHVLASWPDEDAVRILAECRRAMAGHARLLVVNALIPQGNAPHPGKSIDAMMMTVLNGKGRTRDEYEALLDRAGLTVTRVLPVSPHAAVIEAARAERGAAG
ncbi:methyltransferase [Streptomyces sp. NBC_00879]|uniref:methyltransferase n=1 Tax=Streptomyces sp. NBC_00879 TaxID=2975855 RepID=UPI003864C3F5|nr:methyltransferase [Streptomyces sp. NBC_00879]